MANIDIAANQIAGGANKETNGPSLIAAPSTLLFDPIQIGPYTLQHRVALAPLTRLRAHDDHTPSELAATYYEQRASVPGTLLISESTLIAEHAGGYNNFPGIWTPSHIEGWRRIGDRVHSRGSFMFLQLCGLGRIANPEALNNEPLGPHDVVSASDVPIDGTTPVPRPLTVHEIDVYVADYATAAANAIEAGLDGVEVHCGNGCLLDQFLQSVSNHRTDDYGGSISNQARFLLRVMESLAVRIGEDRIGVRFSPYSQFSGMGEADPRPLFSYVVTELRNRFPRLAYIHVIEARGDLTLASPDDAKNVEIDFLRRIWQEGDESRVFLSAGGHTREKAIEEIGRRPSTIAVFGRHFISNPDLPLRLRRGAPLEPYDRSTFYFSGPDNAEGYTTYKTFGESDNRGETKL